MGETVQEQLEYGDHCVHGTNVGTPGGADILCHRCEMGWDTWHSSPHYVLEVAFNFSDPSAVPDGAWFAPTHKATTVARIAAVQRNIVHDLGRLYPIAARYRKVRDGYWA